MNLGRIAVGAIKEWDPFGPQAITRRARNKAFRKARRKAKRGETLTSQELQILETTEEVNVLQGSKSWIGLVTVVIGLLVRIMGWGDCSAEEVAAAVCVPADTLIASLSSAAGEIITGVGITATAIGVEHKRRREKRLLAQANSAGH